jgi:hypothetical protein
MSDLKTQLKFITIITKNFYKICFAEKYNLDYQKMLIVKCWGLTAALGATKFMIIITKNFCEICFAEKINFNKLLFVWQMHKLSCSFMRSKICDKLLFLGCNNQLGAQFVVLRKIDLVNQQQNTPVRRDKHTSLLRREYMTKKKWFINIGNWRQAF